MSAYLEKFFSRLESRPHAWQYLAIISFFTATVRSIEETLLFKEPISASSIINMAYFYLTFGFFITFLVSKTAGIHFERAQNSVQIGLFLGLFPPLIDFATGGWGQRMRYSYYLYWDFGNMPLGFYSPAHNLPLGEAITIWLSILFGSLYVCLKTRAIFRTLLSFTSLYVFFISMLALMPMLTVHVLVGELPLAEPVGSPRITQANACLHFFPYIYTIIIAACYLALRADILKLVRRRLLHAMPFAAVCFLGANLGGVIQLRMEAITVTVLTTLIYTVMAVQNDYYDKNQTVKIRDSDNEFLFLFVALLLFWTILFNKVSAILLTLAYILSLLYHHPRYRAKRYFLASIKMEGSWGALAFLAGVLIHSTVELPLHLPLVALLFFGGFAWISVWKDVKDLRSDRRLGIQTFYLFLQEKGIRLSKIHRWSSSVILSILLLPVLFAVYRTNIPAALVTTAAWLALLALSFRPTFPGWFRFVLTVFTIYIAGLCVNPRI